MRAILVLMLFGLSSCDGAAESAERQYQMVGNDEDRCRIAGEAAEAWLKRENQPKYEEWKLTRDIYCGSVASKRALYR